MSKLTLDECCRACGLPFHAHITEYGIDAAGNEWVAVEMCDAWMLSRYPEPAWDEEWADSVTGLCVLCGQGYSSHWQHGPVIVTIAMRAANVTWGGRGSATRIAGSNATGGVDWRLPLRWVGCRDGVVMAECQK